MFYVLLTILILDAILLCVIVLLQAGKGGGLAAMGGAAAGGDTLLGSRQAATLLTRATWWTGGLFLTLSFVLSIMSSRTARPDTILRDFQGRGATTAPAPAMPGIAEPTQPTTEQLTPAAPPGTTEPGAGTTPAAPPQPAPPGQ